MNTPYKTATLLFNPFYYLAGIKALALGLGVIFLAAVVGFWGNAHFDGVLDTHVGASAPVWVFFAEGVVDWLCLAVALWLAGKIISRTAFRAVDVLGTQALARWPTLLVSVIVLPKAFQRFGAQLMAMLQQGKLQINFSDALVFGIVALAMIPLMCWTVYLMYKSFSVSCNVAGGKAIGTFIAALLIAEIASKTLLAAAVLPAAATPPSATASQPGGIAEAGNRFVSWLAESNFTAAVSNYDDTMKTALPEPALRNAWIGLQKQAGPFQKQISTRTTTQLGYQIAFVTCQFASTNLDIKVVFNDNQKVAGLFFVPSPKN